MAQGFLQRHDIDYDETYSPVVDAIIFRYLISLTTYERLDMCRYMSDGCIHNLFI